MQYYLWSPTGDAGFLEPWGGTQARAFIYQATRERGDPGQMLRKDRKKKNQPIAISE